MTGVCAAMTDIRLFLLGRRAGAAALALAIAAVACYLGWDVAFDTYLLGGHASLPLGTGTVVPPLTAIGVVALCSPANPDADDMAVRRPRAFDAVFVALMGGCAASTAALTHLALALAPGHVVPRFDLYCVRPGCLAESLDGRTIMGEWGIGLLYAAIAIASTTIFGGLSGTVIACVMYAAAVLAGSWPQIAAISPLTVIVAPERAPLWTAVAATAFAGAVTIRWRRRDLRPAFVRMAARTGAPDGFF
ncbi:hypothetical protein [Bifidobacterium phasiani]|uniref:Integral membrane protein n=1 Tax=Bifidobacterium phasiani TaxID=2834431 RepID=A0ABS6WA97_9BIFI|nr:hypothetical protein [Bifidobacterium phasiani]MBW3082681.1 hypothetical protein [Bifidobacterium phasiani]